jgi:hypothetical protein
MMTFADFEPGKTLGRRDFNLTEEMIGLWTGLFPDDRRSLPFMPPAMIAMVVMRAFIEILPDRPRGNVHAGQKFWISRLPQLQDGMTTTFRCLGKEEKGNRRWLTFGSDTVDTADRPLFRGQMTTIWAA